MRQPHTDLQLQELTTLGHALQEVVLDPRTVDCRQALQVRDGVVLDRRPTAPGEQCVEKPGRRGAWCKPHHLRIEEAAFGSEALVYAEAWQRFESGQRRGPGAETVPSDSRRRIRRRPAAPAR